MILLIVHGWGFDAAMWRRLDVVSEGGHLLPVTESSYCATAIRRLLETRA